MERLTVKWADKVYDTFDPVDIVDNEYSKANYNKILTKLGDYEDLEEQGRLIKLPCKVGTDIYYILGIPNETPCIIDSCVFELSDIHKIGKTLFLTKSEAEAKLKELRGGENESSN
jgi:hypothetical protein